MASLKPSFLIKLPLIESIDQLLPFLKELICFLVPCKVVENSFTFNKLNLSANLSLLLSCLIQIFLYELVDILLRSVEESKITIDIFKLSIWKSQRRPIIELPFMHFFESQTDLHLIYWTGLKIMKGECFQQVVVNRLLEHKLWLLASLFHLFKSASRSLSPKSNLLC